MALFPICKSIEKMGLNKLGWIVTFQNAEMINGTFNWKSNKNDNFFLFSYE